MSKEKKSDVEQNNLNVKSNDSDWDEENNESPFWFWVWMGALVLMFIGFGLFNKYYVNGDNQKDNSTPAATSNSEEPTAPQPTETN